MAEIIKKLLNRYESAQSYKMNKGEDRRKRFEQRQQALRGYVRSGEKIYKKGRFTGKYEKIVVPPSRPIGRWQQRVQKYVIATPSSQQRFFKQRAKVLRGVQSAFPQSRIPGVKSQVQGQGRVKQGRGRPKGSYDYAIPGKGKVSVFEYRRWLSNQKKLFQMQMQQQIAMQKVARRFQPQLPQEIQQYQQQVQLPQPQFNPYQYQKPQFAGQSVMPIEPQPFKEISILERTPVNLSGNTLQPLRETYEETDLMTGRKTLKLRNGGFM